MQQDSRKVYLGEGVYAVILRGEILLTTENGINITNSIWLDKTTLTMLIDFLKGEKWL